MKRYIILLSIKEYVLVIVEAENKKEAIDKAFKDDYVQTIPDPEKISKSKHIVERIVEEIPEAVENIENEIDELDADQHPNFHKASPEGRKRMAELLQKMNMLKAKN